MVRVDYAALDSLVRRWLSEGPPGPPDWGDGWHWRGSDADTAMFVVGLDTLNHCFWPGTPRWSVTGPEGQPVNGYRALSLTLSRRAGEGRRDLLEANRLATITADDLADFLGGTGELPWRDERAAHLRNLGTWLRDAWDGQFLKVLEQADGSGVALARTVLQALPSFRDIPAWQGRSLPMLKRLQILVADLAAAFGGSGPGAFRDLDALTAFADYKVPQVLEALGVLEYASPLKDCLRSGEELPWGSEAELAIRAGTVAAVDALADALVLAGVPARPMDVDVHLWTTGQGMALPLPYHRTRNWFY
jgi:hypothetical protein